jgi:hypothetical protein
VTTTESRSPAQNAGAKRGTGTATAMVKFHPSGWRGGKSESNRDCTQS